MLKMKFAVMLTAVIAMFSFTSCLNSEGSSTGYGYDYVIVKGIPGLYSFENAAGYTINPLNASSITNDIGTTYALINYQYEYENVVETTKKIDATITGILPVNSQYISNDFTNVDDFSNAPIKQVSSSFSYDYLPVCFWDKDNMFLPIYYFVKDMKDDDEQKQELDSHRFELLYDENDENANTGELLLHLRHNVQDADINDERESLSLNIFHYNLRYILDQYKTKNDGKTPSKIIIEYEQNSYNSIYESGVESQKVEIDYASIIEASGE